MDLQLPCVKEAIVEVADSIFRLFFIAEPDKPKLATLSRRFVLNNANIRHLSLLREVVAQPLLCDVLWQVLNKQPSRPAPPSASPTTKSGRPTHIAKASQRMELLESKKEDFNAAIHGGKGFNGFHYFWSFW